MNVPSDLLDRLTDLVGDLLDGSSVLLCVDADLSGNEGSALVTVARKHECQQGARSRAALIEIHRDGCMNAGSDGERQNSLFLLPGGSSGSWGSGGLLRSVSHLDVQECFASKDTG